jgi:glutamine amidotransferase
MGTASASAGTAAPAIPASTRSTNPAWNDRNLKEIASDVESKMFLAHVRSSTGGAVQQTNAIRSASASGSSCTTARSTAGCQVKRDLAMAVDPTLYTSIEGTTDSELMFYLALTFGLEKDPPGAVAKMVGLVEKVGRTHGIEKAIQMTWPSLTACESGSSVMRVRMQAGVAVFLDRHSGAAQALSRRAAVQDGRG